MSAGIGGIGGLGGNAGTTHATATPKDSLDSEILKNLLQKKHKSGDASFEAQLNNLNNQKVAGAQSGTTGETGTRINKYA